MRAGFLLAVDLILALVLLASDAAADMPHNDMPHNSISLQGLTKAAPLLHALASGPLDDATIQAAREANPSINDPDVGPLLGKIVSCALDRDTKLVDFPEPPPRTELAGELGLCGSQSPFGNWHTAALSGLNKRGCLEAVSACVLARVNALGHRIVISVRSRSLQMPIPLQNQVPVETQYRNKSSVASFLACSGSNPAPDCGYKPQFVGRCIAGQQVTVAAFAGTGIRICKGLYGCDTLRPMPSYTGVIVNRALDSVRFDCPPNGYYSVMTQPASPTSPADVSASTPGGQYPAEEKEVFTWPEGAFYGNIFEMNLIATARIPAEKAGRTKRARGLAGDEHACDRVLAGDENACYSRVWRDGVAQMNDRFCAGVPGCFINQPMPCFQAPNDRCATNAEASLAFGDCKPTTPAQTHAAWNLAITTYLNDPCDLSADPRCDPVKVAGPDGDRSRRDDRHQDHAKPAGASKK